MKQKIIKKVLLAIVLSAILFTVNIKAEKPDGKAILQALQEVIQTTADKVKSSVVYVELSYKRLQHDEGSRNPYAMFQAPPTPEINGIVLDEEGHILLMSPLKKDAVGKITVWTKDKEYPAAIVKTNEKHGITIIKMKSKISVAPIIIGDSSSVNVGQYLLGVSASGKALNHEKFISLEIVRGKTVRKTFDQILLSGAGEPSGGSQYSFGFGSMGDAKASPPSLGMPLVDLDCRLVGIMGSSGVVAINDIKNIVQKAIAKSKEKEKESDDQEPWAGFEYSEVDKEWAEAFELPKEGIRVTRVYDSSPAGKAGLKTDDLITEINGETIAMVGVEALSKFRKLINPELGKELNLKVLQNGITKTIALKYDKKPKPKEFSSEDLGMTVQEITDIEYYTYGLSTKDGILVKKVTPGSPAGTAEEFGKTLVGQNDIVLEINRNPIKTIDDFIKEVGSIKSEKLEACLIKLLRGRLITNVSLNLKIGQKSKEKRGEK